MCAVGASYLVPSPSFIQRSFTCPDERGGRPPSPLSLRGPLYAAVTLVLWRFWSPVQVGWGDTVFWKADLVFDQIRSKVLATRCRVHGRVPDGGGYKQHPQCLPSRHMRLTEPVCVGKFGEKNDCAPLVTLLQFSRSVVSDSLRPHESQHATPPCPSPTPRAYSDSRASSQ